MKAKIWTYAWTRNACNIDVGRYEVYNIIIIREFFMLRTNAAETAGGGETYSKLILRFWNIYSACAFQTFIRSHDAVARTHACLCIRGRNASYLVLAHTIYLHIVLLYYRVPMRFIERRRRRRPDDGADSERGKTSARRMVFVGSSAHECSEWNVPYLPCWITVT